MATAIYISQFGGETAVDCLICGFRDGDWERCPRCGTLLSALLAEKATDLDIAPVRH
jgi:hypothetical protein